MLIVEWGCKKADPAITIEEQSNVEIASPYESQTFKTNDTVFIKAQINAGVEMHGYEISLVKNDSVVIYAESEHVHCTEIDIEKKWVNNLTGQNELKLTIKATVDHEGMEMSKCIVFKTE